MALKGTRKALSVDHENAVAEAYGGHRSRTSGGAITDEGDVKVVSDGTLFECKGKFGTLLSDKPVASTLLKQFEKVADEAYSVEREPAMALRFYSPESPLSDKEGFIDLVVRLMDDDAHRAFLLDHYRGR